MSRNLGLALLIVTLLTGCSGSSKLTDKSEQKLAGGDSWRAWQLATKALDKEPGNPRAQAAATAAGTAIVQEWQRKIRAFAQTDSMRAAEETLELTEFRENSARYATIPVGAEWPAEERTLRMYASRVHYQLGREAAADGRPKLAYTEFSEAQRFVTGYRDVSKRADQAFSQALTRVAVVPFRVQTGEGTLGAQVAQAWRDDLARSLAPPAAQFTRVLGGDAIERTMTISELDGVTRQDAIRMGRAMGAQRVVWGSVGGIKSSTRLNMFRDAVARRVVVRDAAGHESVQWVEVPIEVVARVRDVTVGVDYDIIAVANGASLAHRHVDRSTTARVVWTSYQPEGDLASYALVAEPIRAANPQRAREIETRWKSVCGDATTLTQVLQARRSTGSSGRYARESLARFAAGAAFVFLEELPPAGDLAYEALATGSAPLREDLQRLDAVDDVDLYAETPGAAAR